jgi:hypothetical protein
VITLSYPTLRPKNAYGVVIMPPKIGETFVMGVRKPDKKDLDLAEKRKVSGEEIVRRDNIVRQLWIACKTNVGEYVVPRLVGDREKYGARLLVKGVFRSYHDFPLAEEWPKDNVPYIITLATDDGAILCTSDFFAKAGNGGTC